MTLGGGSCRPPIGAEDGAAAAVRASAASPNDPGCCSFPFPLAKPPPILSDLGPAIGTPFQVRPLPAAQVVWLNHRWFATQHIDTLDPEVGRQVEAWLLRTFAVEAVEPCKGGLGHLWADRYGGSDGSVHGGSGRCGFVGRFNAKGIGRTPLVPAWMRGSHSDGRVSLVEAVREAICGEIAAGELPYGAVPVVGIVDACPAGAAGEEGRAIVVRPNFVRAAHFERSIYFGTAGFVGSDQYLDAVRVRDAVEAAVHPRTRGSLGFDGLQMMARRFAVQIGASHAHRLWQGRFLSANEAIDGALVDFGSFRAVPSWRAAFGEPEEVFGREVLYLRSAVDSLTREFRKYAPGADHPEPRLIVGKLEAWIEDGFSAAVRNALQLERLPEALVAPVASSLRAYFVSQQRERIQIGDRENWELPWLHDTLLGCGGGPVEERIADELRSTFRSIAATTHDSSGGRVRLTAAARWLRPRPALYYEEQVPMLSEFLRSLKPEEDRGAKISRLIVTMVGQVRRLFPELPPAFEVRGQVTDGPSWALYGYDYERGQNCALLHAPPIADKRRLFGTVVSNEAFSGGRAGTWLEHPVHPEAARDGAAVTIAGQNVALPPATLSY